MLLTVSCSEDRTPSAPADTSTVNINKLVVDSLFMFDMEQTVRLTASVFSQEESPLEGIRIDFYLPTVNGYADKPFFSGVTTASGTFQTTIKLPKTVSKVWVKAHLIAGRNQLEIGILNGNVTAVFGGVSTQRQQPPVSPRVRDGSGHFDEPINTGINMSLIVKDVCRLYTTDSTELVCITQEGAVAGKILLKGEGPWGMAVWGDDPRTVEVDGFLDGEELLFRVWDAQAGEEIHAVFCSDTGGTVFEANGFVAIHLSAIAPLFRYLGSWNAEGYPNYHISPPTALNSNLQKSLSLLTKEKKLADWAPAPDSTELLVQLAADGRIQIKLIHSAIAYPASLGCFVIEGDTLPPSSGDIARHIVLFPYTNLASGSNPPDKSLDVAVGNYREGDRLGWFLVKDGFSADSISSSATRIYSVPHNGANPFHWITLYNRASKMVLVFADVDGDLDYNDLIFGVTSSASDGFVANGLADLPEIQDSDGDLVGDLFDDLPADPHSAFAYTYPADGESQTILFEDEWNHNGDWDFNDLVINSVFALRTNGHNLVHSINAKFTLRAVGTSSHNGFGVQFPISADRVQQFTPSGDNSGSIYRETGHSKLTVILFDDSHTIMTSAGGGTVNTQSGQTMVPAEIFEFSIAFTEPISTDSLIPLINPFLFIGGDRGRELHPADYPPTAHCNFSHLGANEDKSNPAIKRYYRNRSNMTWGLVFPFELRWVYEGEQITTAYPRLYVWISSQGISSTDWNRFGVIEEKVWKP